jgi:hypothetical protein
MAKEGQGLVKACSLGPRHSLPWPGTGLPVMTSLPGPCLLRVPGSSQQSQLPAIAPLRGTCGSDGVEATAAQPSGPRAEATGMGLFPWPQWQKGHTLTREKKVYSLLGAGTQSDSRLLKGVVICTHIGLMTVAWGKLRGHIQS